MVDNEVEDEGTVDGWQNRIQLHIDGFSSSGRVMQLPPQVSPS
jgi:hypothetical protein